MVLANAEIDQYNSRGRTFLLSPLYREKDKDLRRALTMEELFRFTITRSAERTNATTLPLERRSPFQEELVNKAVERGWQLLEETALTYLEANFPWILTIISLTPDPPVPALKQLLSNLHPLHVGSTPDPRHMPLQ